VTELIVYAETDPDLGTRTIWVQRTEVGGVSLEGPDLGRGVSAAFGDDFTEYEWAFTLPPERLDRLLDALGIAREARDALEGVAERLRRMEPRAMQKVFEEAGATFWNRIGD
jgi:hypothetical protein